MILDACPPASAPVLCSEAAGNCRTKESNYSVALSLSNNAKHREKMFAEIPIKYKF